VELYKLYLLNHETPRERQPPLLLAFFPDGVVQRPSVQAEALKFRR